MRHRSYHGTQDVSKLVASLMELTHVEMRNPMLRFTFAKLIADPGINSGKPLYGMLYERGFKVWENSMMWNHPAFTYVHGLISATGSGVAVVMRPRPSLLLSLLFLLPWGLSLWFFWHFKEAFWSDEPASFLLLAGVSVMLGFVVWGPIRYMFHVMGRQAMDFIAEELSLERID